MITSAPPFGPVVNLSWPVALTLTLVVVATSEPGAVQFTVLVSGTVVSAAEYTVRKPAPLVSVTVTVTRAATALGGSEAMSTVVVVFAPIAGTPWTLVGCLESNARSGVGRIVVTSDCGSSCPRTAPFGNG